MYAEGMILKDRDQVAQRIKNEARQLLEQGPAPLSAAEITQLRYQLTDALDDFVGSERCGESYFINSTTRFARITPRLLFFPSTTIPSPSRNPSTSSRSTFSPVALRMLDLPSTRTATSLLSPVLRLSVMPAII